ncbi:TonB-dependent receptor [Limnohabitans sp.]|jgi:outer membrane receptor for ferrienterochelin and colicins|uniref:TonB-dependent receptor plug domain-containing protein n=1 Tax=Limnohabitans sp. TaxID=1907725 RepID=UPI0028994E9E|nr:TonB-dependent receptor [Limnohabitans sp.]
MPLSRVFAASAAVCLAVPVALAQTPSTTPAVTDLGQVEIRGNRNNDTEVRRESTASKIVIGREEIEKQGDATLGDVLKRLPGVTVQGAPGRGGAIRMRGLGGGYTQILLDGERMPPGFSVDSLTPEQVERIEILRAPTAETGAQAIAGTINIVLREGQRANPDDLKITRSQEHGQGSNQLNWVHNLKTEPLSGTFTLSAMDSRRADESVTEIASDFRDPQVRMAQSESHRQGVHANARLQWKGEQGKSLTLTPFLIYSEYAAQGRTDARRLTSPAITDTALTDNQSRYAAARLNGQWSQRLSADDRLEVRFGLGQSQYDQQITQTAVSTTALLANSLDEQRFTDRSTSLNGKWTRVLENGHQLVSGLEHEGVRRVEEASAGAGDDSGNLKASTARWAAYTQDEFKINPNWSAYAGVRYESILTEGQVSETLKRNQSQVWTPLLHALWKPDPAKRDQIRMSLTRSYKTPTLYNLVAPLRYSRDYPISGNNVPTQPDRLGNPDLRPELATGIDLGFERYLEGGGVLSANVFRRNIKDLIRYQTSLQTVNWSNQTRWVSTPQNVGDAVTQGIELEAKFRLNQAWAEAWPVDIRSNVSFFHSKVKEVPGPDNRLDQQPSMTANLGADYRLRGLPLTVGGNVNWNPDYDTRRSQEQFSYQGVKRVVDVYGLWRYSAATALRLTVSNLLPRHYETATTFSSGGASETARTTDRNWRNVQLRVEMKI